MSEAEVAYYTELAKSIGLTVLLVLFVILPIEYVREQRQRRKAKQPNGT